MKPSIPETGTVVKIENGIATVILNGGNACKSCSAGKLGLCKPSGNVSVITAKAVEGINPGDSVRVVLDEASQYKGYFLAFIAPLISLLLGTYVGYVIKRDIIIPYLDVILGFFSFVVSSFFTLRRLKRMDSSVKLSLRKIEEISFSEEIINL